MNGRFVKLLAVAALGSVAMFGAQSTVSLGRNPFPIGNIGPYVASTGFNTNPTTHADWLAQSTANPTASTTTQIANALVLTPVAGSQRPPVDGMTQELFYATPEPATYAMFGIGLVLLSLGTFRRGNNRND